MGIQNHDGIDEEAPDMTSDEGMLGLGVMCQLTAPRLSAKRNLIHAHTSMPLNTCPMLGSSRAAVSTTNRYGGRIDVGTVALVMQPS